jgi:hypothetical protein
MGGDGTSLMGKCLWHGGGYLGSKTEAVEEGYGVTPFYRPGNDESRGAGRRDGGDGGGSSKRDRFQEGR